MSLKVIDESKINPNKYVSKDMLAPAKTWYVLASLSVALVLNFIPLQSFALAIRPDFAALVILFWNINQPQRLSMSIAFCVGLMMDVHHSSVLGHYALVYCVVVYIAAVFRRRVKVFSLVQQIPQIFVMLLIMQSALVIIELLGGANLPSWHYFLGSLSGAIIWPIVAFLLRYPLQHRYDSNVL
ncbi:rod shape-determining protein MreD [Nitrosomonas sp. Nm51]|uniref:rod shape-determining protein MreD n=1 Tax=Nitrosomonas sp. Nm51 TaxID=133720 RepID=UPI0008B90868|nr:rod shape-determining protein MreD [Nitrosomonas sp. Nm51]SER19936.1 rod shape-determining protein MreD [Nitrosomonas sp. Nm51]